MSFAVTPAMQAWLVNNGLLTQEEIDNAPSSADPTDAPENKDGSILSRFSITVLVALFGLQRAMTNEEELQAQKVQIKNSVNEIEVNNMLMDSWRIRGQIMESEWPADDAAQAELARMLREDIAETIAATLFAPRDPEDESIEPRSEEDVAAAEASLTAATNIKKYLDERLAAGDRVSAPTNADLQIALHEWLQAHGMSASLEKILLEGQWMSPTILDGTDTPWPTLQNQALTVINEGTSWEATYWWYNGTFRPVQWISEYGHLLDLDDLYIEDTLRTGETVIDEYGDGYVHATTPQVLEAKGIWTTHWGAGSFSEFEGRTVKEGPVYFDPTNFDPETGEGGIQFFVPREYQKPAMFPLTEIGKEVQVGVRWVRVWSDGENYYQVMSAWPDENERYVARHLDEISEAYRAGRPWEAWIGHTLSGPIVFTRGVDEITMEDRQSWKKRVDERFENLMQSNNTWGGYAQSQQLRMQEVTSSLGTALNMATNFIQRNDRLMGTLLGH